MLTAINLPVQRTRWPLSWSRIVRNCNMTTSVVYSSWCRYMVPALSPSYINVSPWYSLVVYKHTGVSPDSLAPLIVYWRLLACFDLGKLIMFSSLRATIMLKYKVNIVLVAVIVAVLNSFVCFESFCLVS
ncbi:hypothetical protein PV325_013880 [Microctonus aethiopoides]|nr:hypothetical protein PV325_013880 [Microctonus aethiopoides]